MQVVKATSEQAGGSVDWKNPDHYQLGLKLIDARRPTPELKERLQEQLASLHNARAHAKGDLDAFDVFANFAGSGLGLNIPEKQRHGVLRAHVGDTGKTLGQLYADAFGRAHPAMQADLQKKVGNLLSEGWASKGSGDISASFGADKLAELLMALPPDRQTIDLLAPALYPQHRQLWREMSEQADLAKANSVAAYGDKPPASPAEYKKIRDKEVWGKAIQSSERVEEPPSVPGIHSPPPSNEELAHQFLRTLVDQEAALAIDKARSEHPVAAGAGEMAGGLAQFVGIGKLVNGGIALGARAFPRLLQRFGMTAAAERAARLLGRAGGALEGSATKMAAETLASQAALRGTQELTDIEDGAKVTATDALLNSALMGGVSRAGRFLVEAWTGRRIAGAIGAALRNGESPLGPEAVAARMAKLERLPTRMRLVVEMGILETITHGIAGGGAEGDATLEKSPWWELFGRSLGLAGFGTLHSIGRMSTKVPWWGGEGKGLDAVAARAKESLQRENLTARAEKAIRTAASKLPAEETATGQKVEAAPEMPIRTILDEVFGKDAMDTYFKRMAEIPEGERIVEQKMGLDPGATRKVRESAEAAKATVASRAAKPAELGAEKPAQEPARLGSEWASTLKGAVETSKAKITPKETQVFEDVTRAIATHAASRMQRPESDIWGGLGTFEGHAKRPQGIPKNAKAAFDVAKKLTHLYRTADIGSLAHEQGHAFRALLPKRDVAAIRQAVGLSAGQKWGREHEEKFAEQYEAYLKTGKAPDPSAANAFAELKGFLQAAQSTPGITVHPKIAALLATRETPAQGKEATTREKVVKQSAEKQVPRAPEGPDRQEDNAGRPSSSVGAFPFVGKKPLASVEAAHDRASKYLELRKKTSPQPEVEFSLKMAAKAAEFPEAIANLHHALHQTSDVGIRGKIGELIDAIPMPQRISRNPEAVEAVQHLVYGGNETKGGLKEAIEALDQHGLQTFDKRPDGSVEVVTKDGSRFFTLAAGGHDPLLYQMGKADYETAILNHLESSVASVEDTKKGIYKLLKSVLQPEGWPGTSGLLKWLDRNFGLQSDELAKAFHEKHRKAFDGMMSSLFKTLGEMNGLAPEVSAEGYRAMHEGVPLADGHSAQKLVADLTKQFFDMATLFVDNGLLPKVVMDRPYAPHEYKLPERMAVIQKMLKAFGVKKGQSMGGSFVERLKAAWLGKAITTNFKKRTIRTLEEYEERGGEVSLEATIPTLLREARAAHFITQAQDLVLNFPEFWRASPSPSEAPHFTHVKGVQWGPLDGKHIRNDILGEIKGWRRESSEWSRLWDVALANAKGNVTGKNPPTTVGSGVGNLVYNRLSIPWNQMVPMHAFGWREWFRMGAQGLKYNPPAFVKELFEAGLISTEELARHPMKAKAMRADMLSDFREAKAMWEGERLGDGFARMLSGLIKLSDYGFTYAAMQGKMANYAPIARLSGFFTATDRIGMISLYQALRSGKNIYGVEIPKATALAMVEFYNMRNLPPALRGVLGRRGLIPFVAFPYKLMTQSLMQARFRAPLLVPGHPMFPEDKQKQRALAAGEMAFQVLKWMSVMGGAGHLSAKMAGVDYDEYKRQREVASFGAGTLKQMFLVGLGKDENGRIAFLDMRNLFPWIAFTNIARSVGTRDVDRPLIAWLARSNMLSETVYEMVEGHNYFGHQIRGGWGKFWHAIHPFVPNVVRNVAEAASRDYGEGILSRNQLLAKVIGLHMRRDSPELQRLLEYQRKIKEGRVRFLEVPYGQKGDPEAQRAVRQYQRGQRLARKRRRQLGG